MKGEIVMELCPGPGNPRNSEGAFLTLSDGRILFCYSSFTGELAQDHTPANLARITSYDGGKTWTEPETFLLAAGHEAMNVMSVSLMRMQNGDVGLFYLVRKSWSDMRLVLRRSTDEGATFGPATCCMPRAGYFVVNNDRAVRLASGRIVLPAAEHVPTFNANGQARMSAASATCFYSDDDGFTWQESAAPLTLAGVRSSRAGLQEPGLVELKGGVLYGWARTDLGRQYEFFSLDGGAHLSAPVPGPFTSPLSPLSMKRLPDGRLLALWNPIPEYQTRNSSPGTAGRTPLVYALSADEGQAFGEPHILEDNPLCGYCYTAIHVSGDALLLAYCAGDTRLEPLYLNRTRIRRIPLSELPSA